MERLEQVITVSEDGQTVDALYDDTVATLGRVKAAPRASEIEFDLELGGWTVKFTAHSLNAWFKDGYLCSISGYYFAPRVRNNIHVDTAFKTREAALQAEREFLALQLSKGAKCATS